MKRYLLWYNKKHFGRIIICCHEMIFTEAKDALQVGERMQAEDKCLDYNYSIIMAPKLRVPEEIKL